jgi:L-fucose isomerase-like protein
MKYQLIMKRAIEANIDADITRGTLEGDIKPGEITMFRLQSMADTSLHAYIAQGEVLPVATHSFGSIGVFAVKEMARFYRHVLIEKRYPHHGAFAASHIGRVLYETLKMMSVQDISFNQPQNILYKTENPFIM